MKILLVDDNRQVMETIYDYLEAAGHLVDCAYNGVEALSLAASNSFDVIIMDIMMPMLNGINTVDQLRREHRLHTPVLFLTARDTIEDKVNAFGAGGDDYLVKPFSLQELMLRLEALSKRGLRQDVCELEVGELTYDLVNQHVKRCGKSLNLSRMQLQIVKLLMEKHPVLVTRQQIIDTVWGEESPNSDALRSHIYALRNVLNSGFDFNILVTEHGKGYRLVTQEQT